MDSGLYPADFLGLSRLSSLVIYPLASRVCFEPLYSSSLGSKISIEGLFAIAYALDKRSIKGKTNISPLPDLVVPRNKLFVS